MKLERTPNGIGTCSRGNSRSTFVRLSLTLSLAALLSGCSTMVDCGVPLPSGDAIMEMLDENRRAMKGEPMLMPHTHVWHKEVSRACDWGS